MIAISSTYQAKNFRMEYLPKEIQCVEVYYMNQELRCTSAKEVVDTIRNNKL